MGFYNNSKYRTNVSLDNGIIIDDIITNLTTKCKIYNYLKNPTVDLQIIKET